MQQEPRDYESHIRDDSFRQLCKTPVVLMEKEPCDETLDIPIWREIKDLVKEHDSRGEQAIGYMDRFDFYESTKKGFSRCSNR